MPLYRGSKLCVCVLPKRKNAAIFCDDMRSGICIGQRHMAYGNVCVHCCCCVLPPIYKRTRNTCAVASYTRASIATLRAQKLGCFLRIYWEQGIVLLFLCVCNDFVDDFYKIPASLWHGAA